MTRPSALAVFDVDETLTRTNAVDERCFYAAHAAALGADALNGEWGAFTHMTDSCINREIFERVRGRPPRPAEIDTIQADFLARLQAEFEESPVQFDAVPGAAPALAHLVEAQGWAVAFASGGWGHSARFKLGRIGIESDGWPGAFGHEFQSREEIVETAIDRAKTTHGVDGFARVVALGDGIWDLGTARNLGLAFIGIAEGARAAALRQAGAAHVLANYRDLDGFLALLDRAAVP